MAKASLLPLPSERLTVTRWSSQVTSTAFHASAAYAKSDASQLSARTLRSPGSVSQPAWPSTPL